MASPSFPSSVLPAPDATFTVREVALQAAVSLRTLRHYVTHKLLVPPTFRSSRTRYSRDFLVRLRAAITLRRRGLSVPVVRAQLGQTSDDEMIRLAGYLPTPPAPPPGSAAAATPTSLTSSASPTSPTSAALSASALPAGFLGPYRAGATPAREVWEHLDVCPGLKLLVRCEANTEAWRVAQEILALFGPRPG